MAKIIYDPSEIDLPIGPCNLWVIAQARPHSAMRCYHIVSRKPRTLESDIMMERKDMYTDRSSFHYGRNKLLPIDGVRILDFNPDHWPAYYRLLEETNRAYVYAEQTNRDARQEIITRHRTESRELIECHRKELEPFDRQLAETKAAIETNFQRMLAPLLEIQ